MVVYAKDTAVEVAKKGLWRFVDGATTAGELDGRVLVVFAAQYATQLVLPASKRRPLLKRTNTSSADRTREKRAVQHDLQTRPTTPRRFAKAT